MLCFEDKIMPVEEVYRCWGGNGSYRRVDINLLAAGTEEQIRIRTREILVVVQSSAGMFWVRYSPFSQFENESRMVFHIKKTGLSRIF
jgi:hypothetical protein